VLKRSLDWGWLVSVSPGSREWEVACDRAMHRRALTFFVNCTLSIVFNQRGQLLIDDPWVLLLSHHLMDNFIAVLLDGGMTRTSVQLRLSLKLLVHFYLGINLI
jgi:hypothetical protein